MLAGKGAEAKTFFEILLKAPILATITIAHYLGLNHTSMMSSFRQEIDRDSSFIRRFIGKFS